MEMPLVRHEELSRRTPGGLFESVRTLLGTLSESRALRRAELIALSGSQRRDLAFTADDVGRSLWGVDAAVVASRRAAAHPGLLVDFVVVAAL